MDDYAKLRTAHRDGMTIRQIARTFHVSRRKVRDALASPEPTPYTRTKPPPAPVLGPHRDVESGAVGNGDRPKLTRTGGVQVDNFQHQALTS